MKIGRGNSTQIFRPNSSNTMFSRAQAQVEGHARAHAERYSNALNVDGPNMVFWVNRDGSVPCSCRAGRAEAPDSDINPEASFDTAESSDVTIKEVLGHKGATSGSLREARVTQVKGGSKKSLADFERTPQRLNKLTLKENVVSTNIDSFIQSGEYEDDDILDSLDDNGNGGIVDNADPFNLFADKLIECPVCLGTGRIDAWQPQNGLRMVFDTSNIYSFYCTECDIDDTANPTIVSFEPGQSVFWTAKLPLIWDDIIRVNVYNGSQLIHPDWYDWTFAIPAQGISGTVSVGDINALLYDNDLPVNIRLCAKEQFPFTHAEIIFTFAPLVRGQVPEMPQAYEDEYDTWQASVQFELPVDVQVNEGDYIVEAKYQRVWKVNSINFRKTAGGTIYGVSADVRALHKFEKIFYQLSVFRATPYGKKGGQYP